MSLLIKALDNAEKNKQAEKNKKQSGEYVNDELLSLELSPIEQKQSSEKDVSDNVSREISESNSQNQGLTLEEEAGLTSVPSSPSKYAKNKPSSEKATPQSSDPNRAFEEAAIKSKAKIESSAPAVVTPKIVPPTFQNLATKAAEINQQAAAKVFVANQPKKSTSSKSALVILAIAGVLMIWLGLQGYSYIKTLLRPDVVVVRPQVPIQLDATVQPEPAASATTVVEVPQEAAIAPTVDSPAVASATVPQNNVLEKEDTFADEVDTPKKSTNKIAKNNVNDSLTDGETFVQSKSKRTPLKLISKSPTTGVDPTLLSAYEAFTRGEDASAQQQYREVLQQDVRNVDALLGMAAIAQRQGRDADAVGWYQKVLEIEPRNTIAQSALVNTQSNGDAVGAESRIKNMLALQPDSASLHAALGNIYAEQSQWPAAQEAYFNASRFAPNNADYAFNLAISLDQLGKKSLALQQYNRALELLNKSGGASPDRAQLETRIQALQ